MRKLCFVLVAMLCVITTYANRFSYALHSVRLSDVLVRIAEEHPDLQVNFIYNELGNYKVTANVDTDDAHEALRQIVGLNPVSVIKRDGRYYIEALQHGRFMYSGRTIGTDGEAVVAATVMLLTHKDSTVVTYGMTDYEGCFSIPCDREGVTAKIICLGYKPTYRKCESFSLGNIIMTELPVRLRNVNVEAEYSRTYTDKTVYRPTQRQKNASQTGVDLLRNLAIPQISINLVDESVRTLTGGAVAIYVNGLPASSEELQGMRTADVKRVEYLDFPTDPRFNGHEHVINFIMQKYEYGGYTKLSASENVMVGLSSRTSLYLSLINISGPPRPY